MATVVNPARVRSGVGAALDGRQSFHVHTLISRSIYSEALRIKKRCSKRCCRSQSFFQTSIALAFCSLLSSLAFSPASRSQSTTHYSFSGIVLSRVTLSRPGLPQAAGALSLLCSTSQRCCCCTRRCRCFSAPRQNIFVCFPF